MVEVSSSYQLWYCVVNWTIYTHLFADPYLSVIASFFIRCSSVIVNAQWVAITQATDCHIKFGEGSTNEEVAVFVSWSHRIVVFSLSLSPHHLNSTQAAPNTAVVDASSPSPTEG